MAPRCISHGRDHLGSGIAAERRQAQGVREHHVERFVRGEGTQDHSRKQWSVVAMPSRKRPDGQHQDLAHPINDATRKYLTEKVMAEYERELAQPSTGR